MIEVRNGMLVIDQASYPLVAITSLRIDSKTHIGAGVFLLLVCIIAFALASNGDGSGWVVVGVVAGGVALGTFFPEYTLVIGFAGGESHRLTSRKHGQLEALRRQIEVEIAAQRQPAPPPIADDRPIIDMTPPPMTREERFRSFIAASKGGASR
jgi:hypothetical protein